MSTLRICFLTCSTNCSLSNDILRKHGIIPPRPKTPPSPSPPPSPTLQDKLSKLTTSQLSDAADEATDEETERIIQHYHKERLQQLKKLQQARFGRVYPIGREDYTREVTEASNADAQDTEGGGKGTGVVCFLYKDGCVIILTSECLIAGLTYHLQSSAQRSYI